MILDQLFGEFQVFAAQHETNARTVYLRLWSDGSGCAVYRALLVRSDDEIAVEWSSLADGVRVLHQANERGE